MTESISQVHASLTPGASTTRRVRGQTWRFTRLQELSLAGNPAVTVPAPSVCPTCKGDGVLLGHVGALMQSERPCPRCSCEFCGQPTDTPPECRDCAVREDDIQRRREDYA